MQLKKDVWVGWQILKLYCKAFLTMKNDLFWWNSYTSAGLCRRMPFLCFFCLILFYSTWRTKNILHCVKIMLHPTTNTVIFYFGIVLRIEILQWFRQRSTKIGKTYFPYPKSVSYWSNQYCWSINLPINNKKHSFRIQLKL